MKINNEAVRKSEKFIAIIILFIMIAVNFGYELYNKNNDPFKWDFMLLTGYITFMITISYALKIPGKFNLTVERLIHRDAIILNSNDNDSLDTNKVKKVEKNFIDSIIFRKEFTWGFWGSVITSISILLLYIITYTFKRNPDYHLFFIVSETFFAVVLAFIAGKYLGLTILYTGFFKQIKDTIKINVHPGHLDGAAGLKPIGEFYLRLARLALIPAVYLGVWLLIIPVSPFKYLSGAIRYKSWELGFFILFVAAIVFEFLIFILPLLFIHRIMVYEKNNSYDHELNRLMKEINEIRMNLLGTLPTSERELIKEQLEAKCKRYYEIENMPTWPFTIKTIQYLTFQNIAFIIPIVKQILEFIPKNKA
jgi:hypothetical protein